MGSVEFADCRSLQSIIRHFPLQYLVSEREFSGTPLPHRLHGLRNAPAKSINLSVGISHGGNARSPFSHRLTVQTGRLSNFASLLALIPCPVSHSARAVDALGCFAILKTEINVTRCYGKTSTERGEVVF